MSAELKTAFLFMAALAVQQAPETSPRADGTIGGQVVDAATGKPVGVVFVTLSTPVGERHSNQSVLTASGSRFVFRGLPAGEYGLAAIKAGYLPATFDQRRPRHTVDRSRTSRSGHIAQVPRSSDSHAQRRSIRNYRSEAGPLLCPRIPTPGRMGPSICDV